MNELITSQRIKSIWNQNKKKLEDEMLENRVQILEALRLSRPQGDGNILRFNNMDPLFKSMEDNISLCKKMKQYDAKYYQEKLSEKGLYQKTLYRLSNVISNQDGGFWAFRIIGTDRGLIVKPRALGNDRFQENIRIQDLVCDMSAHTWGQSLPKTINFMREGRCKESRVIIFTGEPYHLRQQLDAIEVFPLSQYPWDGEVEMEFYFEEKIWEIGLSSRGRLK